jgi:sigma-B regulation protein RsbU (phosphoserine phosphatase)
MWGRAVEALHKVFPTIDPENLVDVADLARVRNFDAGATIVHEGRLEHTFYIVLDGEAEVVKRMGHGEQRLALKTPGTFFGEMALIEDVPRSATVRALKSCWMLEIDDHVFDQLLERQPSVALTIVRRLSTNLRKTDQAIIENLRRKNEELARAYEELRAAQAQLIEKERLERELEIAGEVQQSILPTDFPALPGLRLAACNRPAREVGGDLYDVIVLDDDHVGLLAADVSDKSAHAAIFMAVTRALFVAQARDFTSPRETLFDIHRLLMEVSTSEMFVTVFYGVLNLHTWEMRFARAGHDRPILYRPATDDLQLLEADGRFLGLLNGLTLEERTVQLAPGDLLVLYSDGMTDAGSARGEPFGLARLQDAVRANENGTAQGICNALFATVLAHQGDAEQFDDMALLVAQIVGAER